MATDSDERIAVLERDLAALDRLVHSQMSGHEREHQLLTEAVNEFKAHLQQELAEMNEVRSQINAERGLYPTVPTLDARIAAEQAHIAAVDASLQARVKALELSLSNYQGRLWMLGGVLTALFIVIKIFWKA